MTLLRVRRNMGADIGRWLHLPQAARMKILGLLMLSWVIHTNSSRAGAE
jgi:hypothetical protein